MQSFLRRGKGAHNGIFCRDRRGLDEPCQPGFGPFGLDAGKGGAGGGKDNPWSKENWNLTKQMELEINDPELAKSLKASAGK